MTGSYIEMTQGLVKFELGRWLGVSHRVGQLMSYWILPVSEIPISCVTVQRLTNLERETDVWKQKMSDFDTRINDRLNIKNSASPRFHDTDLFTDHRLSTEADKEFIEEYSNVINNEDIKETDEDEEMKQGKEDVTFNAPSYVGMEFGLPRDDFEELQFAKDTKEITDEDGTPVGANNNPILYSRILEVEYLD